MKEKFYYTSPVGLLEITTEKDFITDLKIIKDCDRNFGAKIDEDSDFFKKIKEQLDQYFAGELKNFDINLSLTGTDFQKKVWGELQKIPYGQTKTYQEIADLLGSPNAQRAVGSACNKNPIMILIPCHRVISKNCGIGGFAAGVDAKIFLLNLESGCI